MRSTMVRPPMRSSGLGTLSVRGRRRLPRPPTITTATGGGPQRPSNSSAVRTPTRRPFSTTGTAEGAVGDGPRQPPGLVHDHGQAPPARLHPLEGVGHGGGPPDDELVGDD